MTLVASVASNLQVIENSVPIASFAAVPSLIPVTSEKITCQSGMKMETQILIPLITNTNTSHN